MGRFLIIICAVLTLSSLSLSAVKGSSRPQARSPILSNSELAFVGLNLKLVSELQISVDDQRSLNDLLNFFRTNWLQMTVGDVLQVGQSKSTVKVQTFDEFLEKNFKTDYWAETSLHDLTISDLIKKSRPVRFVSENPRVQKQIENFQKARSEMFKEKMSKIFERSLAFGEKVFEQIQEQGESAKPVPQRTSAYFRALLEERMNQTFASDEMILLKKLLISYFRNLPKDRLAEITFEIAKLPLDSSPIDVAGAAILNSGPHLQKLLQLLARHPNLPEKLREIFERLENGAKAVPWKKVVQALENEKVDLKRFTYFERKPLGVGSMAQAHRVQYLTKDQKRKSGVLRLLKPGITLLVAIDEIVLRAVAQDLDRDPELQRFNMPELSPLIEDISKSIAEELDVAQTIRNQNEGARVYTKELLIAFNQQKNYLVMGAPSTFAPIDSTTIMIQDLVIGRKPAKEFDQLKNLYPQLYRKVSEKLTEVWIEEAFFGSGFFHADLHQGNILALYTDSEISIQILDYGMVGRLSSSLQISILLFTVGVQTGNARLIAATLSSLSKRPLNEIEFQNLLAKVIGRLQLQKLSSKSGSFDSSLEGWTAWALSEKIEFNYEFLKLNRALQAIKGLLLDSGSPLSVQDIAKDVTLKYKARFSKIVLRDPHLKAKDYSILLKEFFPQKSEASIVETQLMNKPVDQKVLRCESLFK